jgi:hypothetical protein
MSSMKNDGLNDVDVKKLAQKLQDEAEWAEKNREAALNDLTSTPKMYTRI